MSRLLVRPGPPAGPVRLAPPGDKSLSHRALILGALAEGETVIHGLLQAEDCRHTAEALRLMGVKMSAWGEEPFRLRGGGRQGLITPCCPLDLGNSGTGFRLLMGVIAGQNFSAALTGDNSLRSRPMGRVAEPLTEMGAFVECTGPRCTPPVMVHGAPLLPIHYTSPVASAQVKSAILLAGLNASGETSVTEPSLSRDHTERMLRAFGADVPVEAGLPLFASERGQRSLLRRGEAGPTVRLRGQPTLHGQEITIPGDFSSAAFFLVAGCLVPGLDLTLENVLLNPTRSGLLEALRAMGAKIELSDEREVSGEPVGTLRPHFSTLTSAEIGGELIPRLIDEVPILALAATQASGPTIIRDAAELKVKESDRLATTAQALTALGANVQTTKDGLIIVGPTPLHSAEIDGRGDHRIAMMAAIAGLIVSGQTSVSGAECIATSFPNFAAYLARLGAEVEVR